MSHINLFNFKLLLSDGFFSHSDNIRTNTEVIPQDGGIESWGSDSQLATHCLSIRLKYPPLYLENQILLLKSPLFMVFYYVQVNTTVIERHGISCQK